MLEKSLLIGALILFIVVTALMLRHKDTTIVPEVNTSGTSHVEIIPDSVTPDIAKFSDPEEIAKGDGYGMLSNPGGAVYMGNIKNGLSHGTGKVTYSGGASYQGEFSEGWPHGKGICTYSSGEAQACVFVNGQRQ